MEKNIEDLRLERKKSHSLENIVFITGKEMCFAHLKISGKSNEINLIQMLLDFLDLKDVLVKIDALGCQRKIMTN